MIFTTHKRLDAVEKKGKPVNLLWVTDSHLSTAVDNKPDDINAVDSMDRYIFDGTRRLSHFVNYANAKNPDFAVHTGDLMHHHLGENVESLTQAVSVLNGLTVDYAANVGNHEFTNMSHDTVTDILGYQSKPKIVGSKLNESFVVDNGEIGEDKNAIKVIMLDTNISNGVDIALTNGKASVELIAWLKSELLSCEQTVAVVCSHHGFINNYNFESSDGNSIREAVNQAISENNALIKVYNLYGHTHAKFVVFDPSRPLTGINGACLVNTTVGKYNDIKFYKDGSYRNEIIQIPEI